MENSNKTANKILSEYFEGKSFEFVKATCKSILSVFDEKELTKTEIDNHKTTLENLSALRQFSQERGVIQITEV